MASGERRFPYLRRQPVSLHQLPRDQALEHPEHLVILIAGRGSGRLDNGFTLQKFSQRSLTKGGWENLITMLISCRGLGGEGWIFAGEEVI